MTTSNTTVNPGGAHLRSEQGAALTVVVLFILTLLGMAGLGIDVAQLASVRATLQNVADAAALAGAADLAKGENPKPAARKFARLNDPGPGVIVRAADVDIGSWNWTTGGFTDGAYPANAVRVTAMRTVDRGNPMTTIVLGALGIRTADVVAVAVAALPPSGVRARFLIDDEMIDSDEPVIENLARAYRMDKDEIIRDEDGDGYIDLPPGEILELPTGQVGDEGMFEIDSSLFRFQPDSSPYDLEDFLVHQDGDGPIPDHLLDPCVGVSPVANGDRFDSFIDPDQILVSPVYKSDISDLDFGEVNAKGERRGLLAYSIVDVGSDPDGSGSRLPNLVILVRSPSEVNLDSVELGSSTGSAKLVD